MNSWLNDWIYYEFKWINDLKDIYMNKWMNKWINDINEYMDRWMNELKD